MNRCFSELDLGQTLAFAAKERGWGDSSTQFTDDLEDKAEHAKACEKCREKYHRFQQLMKLFKDVS